MTYNVLFHPTTLIDISAKTGGIGVPLQTSNSKNSGFKIFCDDDPGAQSSLPPSTGEWQMPPTQQVIKKENTQKPGKWTDAKVQLLLPLVSAQVMRRLLNHLHVEKFSFSFRVDS